MKLSTHFKETKDPLRVGEKFDAIVGMTTLNALEDMERSLRDGRNQEVTKSTLIIQTKTMTSEEAKDKKEINDKITPGMPTVPSSDYLRKYPKPSTGNSLYKLFHGEQTDHNKRSSTAWGVMEQNKASADTP